MTIDPAGLEILPASAGEGPAVLAFLEAGGFFRHCELEIAREVFDEAAENRPGCTYRSYTARAGGRPVGWICFGPTPCTEGTFDIYWIGVDPACQRMKIGTRLLDFAEKEIALSGGRLVVIETSGSDLYTPTQKFYLQNGFCLSARIKDFYAPGDDKLIYLKAL